MNARAASVTDPVLIHGSPTNLDRPNQLASAGAAPLDPSTAAAGRAVLVTGNGYLAVSTNSGASFTYLHAYDGPGFTGIFGTDDVDGGGEQDQVVQYDPHTQTFFWLIQNYCAIGGVSTDCGSKSAQDRERLAFIDYDTLVRTGGQTGWSGYDMTPEALGVPGAWFDYPDMALNDKFLYITFDVFHPTPPGSEGAAWVRISLDDFHKHLDQLPFLAQHLTSGAGDHRFLYRPVQGVTGGTGYAVHENSDSQIALLRWPESGPVQPPLPVDHPTTPQDRATCSAVTADGLDFIKAGRDPPYNCAEPSDHPGGAGAAMDGAGHIWVAWTAGRRLQGSTADSFKQAHIEVSTIGDVTGTPKEIRHRAIFNDDYAFAYPYLTSGPTGDIAMTYMTGGASRRPSWGVGFLNGTESFHRIVEGTGTYERMGDFLAVRPLGGQPGLYAATGDVITSDQSGQFQQPWYAVFGRKGDVPPRFASSLAVTCSPTVHPGDPIAVTGRVQPPGAVGELVTLRYKTASGTVERTVTIGAGGGFSDNYPTNGGDSGTATVTAVWPGDFSGAGSESSPCSTSVEPPVQGLIQGSISLSCRYNGNALIDGRITPGRPAKVDIYGSNNNGDSFHDQVATNLITGAFSDTHYVGFNTYTWTVTAHVAGDATFSELNGSCSFQDVPPPIK
jgi:hypothetical protein